MPERLEVIRSTAGRDKDTYLVVLECSCGCVIAADGRARPLERPKKKNPRHIEPTGAKLSEQELRSDKALNRALREYARQLAESAD